MLSRRLRVALSTLMISCVTSLAHAQSCGDVLKYGVWETHNSTSDFYSNKSFKNWACSQSRSSTSASIIDLGSFSKEQFNKMCAGTETSEQIFASTKEAITKASSQLVETWKACMVSEGSHASFKLGDSLRTFTLDFRRRDFRGDNKDTATILYEGGQIECRGIEQTKAGRFEIPFEGGIAIVCTRQNPAEELSMVVNFLKSSPEQIYIGASPITYTTDAVDSPVSEHVSSGFKQPCQHYCESKEVCFTPAGLDQEFDIKTITFVRKNGSGPDAQAGGRLLQPVHPRRICFVAFATTYDDQSSAVGGSVYARVFVKTPSK